MTGYKNQNFINHLTSNKNYRWCPCVDDFFKVTHLKIFEKATRKTENMKQFMENSLQQNKDNKKPFPCSSWRLKLNTIVIDDQTGAKYSSVVYIRNRVGVHSVLASSPSADCFNKVM